MTKIRILQLLQWKIRDIIFELDDIKNQGFTHIQISPIQPKKDEGNDWWLYYQPCSLLIKNSTGDNYDLTELCNKAHQLNIKIIVDVVLRHVASNDYNTNIPHEKVDKELLRFIVDRPFMDDTNRESSITGSAGMPMLDYDSEGIQPLYFKFLDELKSCGVDMFRIDMGKHMRLPREGGLFTKNIVNIYGKGSLIWEVLFEEDINILKQYAEIGYVFSINSMSDKSRLIHCVSCHDTDLNTNGVGFTRNMSDETMVKEYDILCGYAPNTLFYARQWNDTWKSEIIKYINKK